MNQNVIRIHVVNIVPEPALEVPYHGMLLRIPLSDLLCIEAEVHYLNLTLKKGSLRVRMPLKDIESRLESSCFIKINRGTLVNLDRIHSLDAGTVTLPGGRRLPISEKGRSRVLEAWRSHRILQLLDG